MRLLKGISHIISAVLLFLTIIVASITLYSLFDYSNPEKPTFVKVEILGIFDKGSKNGDQILVLKHIAGDPINVKEMKIHITILRRDSIRSCTIQNFPWKYGVGVNNLPQNAVIGDNIVDNNPNHYSDYLGEIGYKSDGVWSNGETVGFRIKHGYLSKGDRVDVSI